MGVVATAVEEWAAEGWVEAVREAEGSLVAVGTEAAGTVEAGWVAAAAGRATATAAAEAGAALAALVTRAAPVAWQAVPAGCGRGRQSR